MIIAIFLFLILTIVGFVILRSIVNEKRLFTLLPAGMLVGPVVYIFLLNWNSKIFHGQSGIILSTAELILLSFFLYRKYRHKWINLESFKPSFKIFYLYFVILIIFLATLKMTTMFPAADSSMQWAYAASFARGNFPIKAPWQPDLNPNYHLGAYFLEGALNSLSGLQYLPIHTLFNIYILIACSLLAIFLLWENRYSFKNIWLILACLILFISYGVIILIYPNFSSQPQQIINLHNLDQLLGSILTKQGGGAPLVSLDFLSQLPARSLSLGFALLALYFSFVPFKSSKLKVLSFVLLLSTTALVEESMFLPLFATICAVFALSLFSFLPKLEYLKSHRKSLILIILITSVLIIFQGGLISENIFNQSKSVFQIKIPFYTTYSISSFSMINAINLNSISLWGIINWFIPSPIWFILILFIYSYIKRKPLFGLVGIFSAVAFSAFLSIEYKYCGACSVRLHSFGNIAAGFGITLLLFSVFKNLSTKKNLAALFILSPILFIPTLLPDLIAQSKGVDNGLKNQMRQVIFKPPSPSPQNTMTNWANKNLPINTRIIAVDGEFPRPSGSLNFQYNGIYTIFGPQYIHVNRQEPGPEFFDLALTLNPSLFRKTKAEYLYIESTSQAYKQLPQFRKDDVSNSKFFEVLQSIDAKDDFGTDKFYRLYKVKSEYLDPNIGGKEIEDGTLLKLQRLIPNNKSVYITRYGDPPMLDFWYRMATILALKDKDIRRDLSQTDYQVIETDIPYRTGMPEKEYDYYIQAPNEKPPFPSTLIWSNILASAWKRN